MMGRGSQSLRVGGKNFPPFLRKWELVAERAQLRALAAAFIHCKNIRVAVKGTFAISLFGHFHVARTTALDTLNRGY